MRNDFNFYSSVLILQSAKFKATAIVTNSLQKIGGVKYRTKPLQHRTKLLQKAEPKTVFSALLFYFFC